MQAQDSTFTIGTGYSFLRADELVYENDDRISHLIWHSDAPTVTVQGKVDLGNEWSLNINTRMAASGNSRMPDYDWLLPHRRRLISPTGLIAPRTQTRCCTTILLVISRSERR